jgi:transposase
MFKEGLKQATVAHILGVSRQSASRWYKAWQKAGDEAMEGAGRAGRKTKLDPAQLKLIDEELRKGARAHGFSTDLWTLKRLAQVIKTLTGVQFHPGHVWRLLGAMGWSLQRPEKRAKERNEAAVRQWVEKKWPELKKKPRESAAGSSSKTKAGSPKGLRSAEPGLLEEKPRS